MKRWGAVVVVVVLLAAALGWFFMRRGPATPPAGVSAPSAPAATKKAAPGQGLSPTVAPFSREADAEGTLVLEGLVVDEAGAPIAGAKVWLSSEPKRETTTEDDGSFSFDKLLGRTYFLSAQSGDLVGGASHLLTDKSPPVTITVKQGSTLVVSVTGDQGPVSGARVAVEALATAQATTGEDGKATLRGVGEGWTSLKVRADGYAAYAELIEVPHGTKEVAVRLKKGAPVSGRVVDQAGKAVAAAKIYAIDASSFYGELDSEPAAQSDDKGEFTIAAVAPGSYRFRARHADYATATSAITQVDERGAKTAVVLTMNTGITLAGRVVDAAKQPVPYANVALGGRGGFGGMRGGDGDGNRQTTAGADGAFEIKHVLIPEQPDALEQLVVRAESETAASKARSLAELAPTATGKQDVTGLELILDQIGSISGITVTESGEVVPEAVVTAYLDFQKNGSEARDLVGGATATSDGDGRFVLKGLSDAEYSLSASRSGSAGMWWGGAQNAVSAKPGATNVKVTVVGEGKVIGKVVYSDGSAPTAGMARLGWQHRADIVDGAFAVERVPAGNYALRVRGTGFAEGSKDNVTVKSGETTDVGTITVERGRTLSGVVRDGSGKPVAGAMVYLGDMIIATGTSIADAGTATGGEFRGMRTTESGADGGFSIAGVGPKETNVVAESAGGRSYSVAVPAGTTNVAGLALELQAFGSLRGMATMGGKPVAAQIIAGVAGEIRSISVVNAGEDGAFVIERLPAGAYRVTAQVGGGMGNASGAASVTIKAGAQAEVAVDIPVGDVELTVEVKGKDGAKIDAAQIFTFRGTVAAKNGKELGDAFGKAEGAAMQFWFGGGFPKFAKLVPTNYTVCTIPIAGNIADQATMQKINEHAGELDVYCQAVVVAASPKQQTFTHIVPPMKPLP